MDLHRALLPDDRHPGMREVQNWIGGDDWHPLDADFVPPPPDRVPALMADLVEYMNGVVHAPLIQAAIVHAQFETVHPFTDGSGRVGRALIHAVLSRRGVDPHCSGSGQPGPADTLRRIRGRPDRIPLPRAGRLHCGPGRRRRLAARLAEEEADRTFLGRIEASVVWAP